MKVSSWTVARICQISSTHNFLESVIFVIITNNKCSNTFSDAVTPLLLEYLWQEEEEVSEMWQFWDDTVTEFELEKRTTTRMESCTPIWSKHIH
jgi:hypothetical protein